MPDARLQRTREVYHVDAAEFEAMTGRPPSDDDLPRVNCQQRGSPGHVFCGVCVHGKPLWECEPCSSVSAQILKP